jgi:hypothetical protein
MYMINHSTLSFSVSPNCLVATSNRLKKSSSYAALSENSGTPKVPGPGIFAEPMLLVVGEVPEPSPADMLGLGVDCGGEMG